MHYHLNVKVASLQVLQKLRRNIELNKSKLKCEPEVQELDWEKCSSSGSTSQLGELVSDVDVLLATGNFDIILYNLFLYYFRIHGCIFV